jgi:hypothetical protein
MRIHNRSGTGATLALSLLVGACGGGGGDPPPADAGGVGGSGGGGVIIISAGPRVGGYWVGTVDAQRELRMSVVGAYEVIGVYSLAGNPDVVAGVIRQTLASAGNATYVPDGAGVDVSFEGLGTRAADLDFSLTQGGGLSGTLTHPATSESRSVLATGQSVSSRWTPHAMDVAGSYSGTGYAPGATETGIVSIDAAGALTGTMAGGCSFTGTVTGIHQGDAYAVTLEFGGGGCANGDRTLTGVIPYAPPHDEVRITATDAAGTDAFVFVGSRS